MSKPIVVINVLHEETFNDCHISGSINVPLEKLAEYAQTSIDPDTEIVVYSASFACTVSDEAYQLLADLNFPHVYIYPGGAAQWVQLQYPTQGACQKAYLGQQESNHDRTAPTITAQDLRKKMEEQGLLS